MKILFLTDYYYPNPTSIGACVGKVINQLHKEGHVVHVLCFGRRNQVCAEKTGVCSVHFVRNRLWSELETSGNDVLSCTGKIMERICQAAFFPFFPCTSITVPYRYWKIAENLYQRYHFEIIVASYAPFEAMYTGYLMKKKHPEARIVSYILDTFSNRGQSRFFSGKWNEKQGWKWEKKMFPVYDDNIIMQCHEQHHKKSRYRFLRNKIKTADIPLMDLSLLHSRNVRARGGECLC